ncbi:cobalt-zinc-cadmium resistance protein CzcC [Geobacter sp. OR-1]|uniref:TolC family protein n=1 Tax=Geobacter sp. OR-1 TaxID=1266765 RepID=UPI000542ED1C|nr:TolC family protein [Geobacter sp. OR-1]GAM08355.1 cobalt-zinc-cadmium resistance protein CzcC [Geobacter sp. OR-1]
MSLTTLVRGTVLFLLLSAFACLPALAGPVPRSINEIVALALKHSAELIALEKEASAKQSLSIQAGTISNPTLELQGVTGSLTGSPEERSVSIGINQELPLNNKLLLRREVILRDAEAAHYQRNNAARLLQDEIIALTLDYSLTAKRQELAAELVKLNRELVVVAEERFKAGDIPELDFNLAKVELARAQTRLLEAERDKDPHRVKIASLTGLEGADINLSEMFISPKLSQGVQELVKQALVFRPDLLMLAREREKAEIEAHLSEAEALPNLTAGLFVQWQRGTTEIGGMSSVNSDTQLGLRLSMPIPVFDRNQGGRHAARAHQDSADSRKLALERNITAEVEAAVSRVTASERILAMFEQGIIPQLTENLKLTQEAYRIGEVGILSVIDEQKKFFEVSDSYLVAIYGRQMAFLKLETAMATELSGGMQ